MPASSKVVTRINNAKDKARESGARVKDLTGKKFGTLTANEIDENRGTSPTYFWLCSCDCGAVGVRVRGNQLTSGIATSCGCRSTKSGFNVKRSYQAPLEVTANV